MKLDRLWAAIRVLKIEQIVADLFSGDYSSLCIRYWHWYLTPCSANPKTERSGVFEGHNVRDFLVDDHGLETHSAGLQ